MKLTAPKYYKDFKCIADRCKHSCCIGWEIDVDSDTFIKYKNTEHSYCKNILDSISTEPTPHFKLTANERCPHLDSNGLCKIIRELSEDFLCDICTEHPRFYNFTKNGKEVGIGMACEEAARIILSSDDYDTFDKIKEDDEDILCFSDFDATLERKKIYALLKNAISYEDTIKSIKEKYSIFDESLTEQKCKQTILEFEYLNEENKELFSAISFDRSYFDNNSKFLKRAFAYFLYRYTAEAYDEAEFRVLVGLSLFLEQLYASIIKPLEKEDFEAVIGLARKLSEEIEYSEDNVDKIKSLFI